MYNKPKPAYTDNTKITGSALAMGVLGVILFSTKAVLVKLIYQFDINPMPLLLLRMLFSLPFFLAFAIFQGPKQQKTIRAIDYFQVFLLGFLGYYLASYFDFLGLQYIEASLERIILFLYPTIVILISRFRLKKRISKPQILAIVISYIGIAVIFGGELGISDSHALWGAFLVFCSAVTYAVYLVGSGQLIPKFGILTYTAYALSVSCVCVIIHYLLTDRSDLWQYPKEVYFLAMIMAIFSTVIPSFLVSAAIKRMGAANFSLLGSLGPISTILMAGILLGEEVSLLKGVGVIIVIVGVYVASKKRPE